MSHILDIARINELERSMERSTRYEKLESLVITVSRAMIVEAFNRDTMGYESADRELRRTLGDDESAEIEVARLAFSGTRSDESAYSGWCIASPEKFMTTTSGGKIMYLSTNRGVYHYKCAERKALEIWKAQFRDVNRWDLMVSKEAVMDIFTRVNSGEWLGQHHANTIYAQEVAELLGMPNHDSLGTDNPIWKILDDLYAEERIELGGAMLCPYQKRFRFPKEIQDLLAYIIEEPLGWPNGEAGTGAVTAIEGAIEAQAHYTHGADLVGAHNFPHIASYHLLQFGLAWMRSAINYSLQNPDAPDAVQKIYDPKNLVTRLEGLVQDVKKISPQK